MHEQTEHTVTDQVTTAQVTGTRFRTIIDRFIAFSVVPLVIVIIAWALYVAFGYIPVLKASCSALASILLVFIGVVLLTRFADIGIVALQSALKNEDENTNIGKTIGAGIVCLWLVIGMVSSLQFAGSLDASQQGLVAIEFLCLGFQLRRILLGK